MGDIFTTIGDVEKVNKLRFDKYGVRTPFIEALFYLVGSNGAITFKPKLPEFSEFMSDEQFEEYVLKMPIDIGKFNKGAIGHSDTIEDEIFPDNRDVFTIKHIPYIHNWLHNHDYFEINYMYKGTCVQHLGNETQMLGEGDVCIIPPFSKHDILTEPGCLAISIAVRKSTFDKVFWNLLAQKDLLASFFTYSLYEKKTDPNFLILHTGNNLSIKNLVQNIMMESNTSDAYSNNCAVSLLGVFFGKILRDYGNTLRIYDEESVMRRKFDFSLMLQYIQRNYQTVSLKSLASTFRYSETYLSKLIKENMGKSFIEMVQGFKMKQASEALTNTSMKIQEVSELVGYDSVDHFSRTFKKAFGISPLSYRKSMTQEQVIN